MTAASPETTVFLLTILLAFIHLLVTSAIQTRLHGLPVLAGARDSLKPVDSPLLGRAQRANNNLRETLPWALGLLLLVMVTGTTSATTAAAAWVYLIARTAYLPLYLLGVPWLRTVAWFVALGALATLGLAAAG